MSFMFYGCSSLKDIVVSNFITHSARMEGMFFGCPDELKIKIQFLHKNFDYEAFSDDFYEDLIYCELYDYKLMWN